MRAAYASGVLVAFQENGLRPSAVYGTSAGAVLGAWFAAGLAHEGARTWEHVGDRRIMSYRRSILMRGPLLDFRFLYSTLYPETLGMDVAALRRAPYPVHATVCDADSGEALYPDLRTVDDPLAYFHATSAIPLAAEAPVTVDGRRLLDGGVLDPIPLRRAVEDGAREVVLVLNRPEGERRPEPRVVAEMIARRFPAVADSMRRHHELHNDAIIFAQHPPPGVRVRVVRPSGDTRLSRLTRDLGRIRAGIALGRADGAAALARWASTEAVA